MSRCARRQAIASTPRHLDQLRFILAAQRDRYLPLRVIREQLEAADGASDRSDRHAPPRPGRRRRRRWTLRRTASLVGQRAPGAELGDARMTERN